MEIPFIQSPNYERNVAREGDDTNTCIYCGKRITSMDDNTKSIHLTTNGTVTDEEEHEASQGWFPIGRECCKRYPARFIF